jgi:hypothetical protein
VTLGTGIRLVVSQIAMLEANSGPSRVQKVAGSGCIDLGTRRGRRLPTMQIPNFGNSLDQMALGRAGDLPALDLGC